MMTKKERKEYYKNYCKKNKIPLYKKTIEYRKNTDYNKKQRYEYMKDRYEIIAFLGGECIICGETDIRCLQIDHVNGGGTKERKENSSGYYKKILKSVKEG